MKANRFLISAALAAAALGVAGTAAASDVFWSVGVHAAPGVNVRVGNAVVAPPVYYQPRPVYYAPAPQPVYVQPAPTYYSPPPPVYYQPRPVFYSPPPAVIVRPGYGYGPRHHGWDRGRGPWPSPLKRQRRSVGYIALKRWA